MKVIIPVAGKGTRMRPFTHTKPKPLLPVAGKPVIEHIFDRVLPLDPKLFVFVTGHLGKEFITYIHEHHPQMHAAFAEQAIPRGSAQAIWLGREAFTEDVLIVFADTIFDVDLSAIKHCKDDGIFWAMEVDDPSRFGVLVTDENGHITKIVEKPKEPVSKLANIGLYYIKNTKLFLEGLEYALRNIHTTEKEIYHVDAFNYMIEHGAKIKVLPAEGWYDTGTTEETLQTNKALLSKLGGEASHSIIPPVSIDPSARIENSTIGPFVSIGPNVVIKGSKINDSIIDEHSKIIDSELEHSILGVHVQVEGKKGKFILGDHSHVLGSK